TVQANDQFTGQVSGTATGSVNATDDGKTVSVTITTAFSANIQGTIYAADGQTPLAFAPVQVFDPINNTQLSSTSTDANGFYQFQDVAPNTSAFQIVAQAPGNPSVSTSTNGPFTTLGQTLTVNLTMQASILTGTVTFSNGSAVSFPTVFV